MNAPQQLAPDILCLAHTAKQIEWCDRAMMSFAFHKFSMRLESKAKELGKLVLRVCEAYTSKTASWTGELKQIGAAKKITSNGIAVDRDINGARGIFLRALVDTPSLRNERAIVGVQ